VDKVYELYDYVQAEILKDGQRYVLTAGVWFAVDDDYVKRVRDEVAAITDLTEILNMPAWPRSAETGRYVVEGDYNKQVAQDRNYALLDADNLHFGGQRKIEVCDLLTADKQLVCVKMASKSSTLSHLFAQGSVSASLMHEQNYKDRLLAGLRDTGVEEVWGSATEWTVVYAIGTEKPGKVADSLFFFSQINLLSHVRDIKSRNVGVALALIPLAPPVTA
jgi:uncharacterized protein (TIGR04141 family)